jgi:hypothetical protein
LQFCKFVRIAEESKLRIQSAAENSPLCAVLYALFRKSFRYSNKARARIVFEQPIQNKLFDELGRAAMQDVQMLLFTVVFFGLAFLYVKACQKLR